MSDKAINALAAKIKLLILDVDGVLTNGQFMLGPNGEEYKQFNTQDGQGMRSLMDSGVQIGIITGRNSPVVAQRAKDLGLQFLYQGRREKMSALKAMLSEATLTANQAAYVGDDWPDIPVMQHVGLAIAVNNACAETKQAAHYITQANGGAGAVREVCELLLKAQNTFAKIINSYAKQPT